MGSDWILGSQWAAAEDDEDEDEVGEDVVMDQSVAGHTDTADGDKELVLEASRPSMKDTRISFKKLEHRLWVKLTTQQNTLHLK